MRAFFMPLFLMMLRSDTCAFLVPLYWELCSAGHKGARRMSSLALLICLCISAFSPFSSAFFCGSVLAQFAKGWNRILLVPRQVHTRWHARAAACKRRRCLAELTSSAGRDECFIECGQYTAGSIFNRSMTSAEGEAGLGCRRYRYKSSQNATSFARRFTRLAGLKLLLLNELDAQNKASASVLQALADLMKSCAELPPGFVEQVRLLHDYFAFLFAFLRNFTFFSPFWLFFVYFNSRCADMCARACVRLEYEKPQDTSTFLIWAGMDGRRRGLAAGAEPSWVSRGPCALTVAWTSYPWPGSSACTASPPESLGDPASKFLLRLRSRECELPSETQATYLKHFDVPFRVAHACSCVWQIQICM